MFAAEDLKLPDYGAQLFAGAAKPILDDLIGALASHDRMIAGSRVAGDPNMGRVLSESQEVGSMVAQLVGAKSKPVRAILFDKNERNNWALGWHQDRTICVMHRIDTPGFGRWTTKQGLTHVEPPFALLERMVTLRIHLDPVDASNAPLLIAPRSHSWGRISEQEVSAVVAECGQFTCLAAAGDIWAYATPILHASNRSTAGTRRRVLQVDYSADDLPNGMEWRGL